MITVNNIWYNLLSLISSWRLASPRAENRSSLMRVSALRLFSRWAFLSCIADRADINISVSLWLSLYCLRLCKYVKSNGIQKYSVLFNQLKCLQESAIHLHLSFGCQVSVIFKFEFPSQLFTLCFQITSPGSTTFCALISVTIKIILTITVVHNHSVPPNMLSMAGLNVMSPSHILRMLLFFMSMW